MNQEISTLERSQIKQALIDFRKGEGEQDIDVFTDGLLAKLELFRSEPVDTAVDPAASKDTPS